MKRLLLILAALVCLAGCDKTPNGDRVKGFYISTADKQPIEVKIAPNPAQDAKIKKLEDRVEALERWAETYGRKYK